MDLMWQNHECSRMAIWGVSVEEHHDMLPEFSPGFKTFLNIMSPVL